MQIEIVKNKLEKIRDLREFFRPYVEKSRGVLYGHDEPADYIIELLAGLNDLDVKALKNDAYFLTLAETDKNLPQDARVEIGRQIGDGVLGVFGFFPEIAEHRHEHRDRSFFTAVGSRAYGMASAYNTEEEGELFGELARFFPHYLDVVRGVRARLDYEQSIDYQVELTLQAAELRKDICTRIFPTVITK